MAAVPHCLSIWLTRLYQCNQLSIRASTRTQEKDVECYSQSLEALTVEDRAQMSHYNAYQNGLIHRERRSG